MYGPEIPDVFLRIKLDKEMGVDLKYFYYRINNIINNTKIWTKIMNMVSDYLNLGEHGNIPQSESHLVYDRDKISSAISFSSGNLVKKRKFCLNGTPNESLCNKKLLKVSAAKKREGMGANMNLRFWL